MVLPYVFCYVQKVLPLVNYRSRSGGDPSGGFFILLMDLYPGHYQPWYTQMLHGAGIFTYIETQKMAQWCRYIFQHHGACGIYGNHHIFIIKYIQPPYLYGCYNDTYHYTDYTSWCFHGNFYNWDSPHSVRSSFTQSSRPRAEAAALHHGALHEAGRGGGTPKRCRSLVFGGRWWSQNTGTPHSWLVFARENMPLK